VFLKNKLKKFETEWIS